MRAKSQHPERKNRKLVCENSQFHIFFDELTLQGRTTVSDYLVVAPKRVAADLITGVAILPVVDGKIGLIRIYRHPIQQYSWEIPRGFIDQREASASAAGRELKEETGLDCKPEAIRSLAFITPDGGILAARVQLFAAMECAKEREYAPAEIGHRELRFFNIQEVEGMILRSELQDPSTIIAFFMYRQFEKKVLDGPV
jgi:ADP-ribose pyrophosphatase YjhB (NUDIX family)